MLQIMQMLRSLSSRTSPCSGPALVTLRWAQDLNGEAALSLADVPIAKDVVVTVSRAPCSCPLLLACGSRDSVSAPSFQGAFDQRMKTWQRWQDAQTMLQKKREMEARLLWANKPDKLQQAKEEISEVGNEECWDLCSAPSLHALLRSSEKGTF